MLQPSIGEGGKRERPPPCVLAKPHLHFAFNAARAWAVLELEVPELAVDIDAALAVGQRDDVIGTAWKRLRCRLAEIRLARLGIPGKTLEAKIGRRGGDGGQCECDD